MSLANRTNTAMTNLHSVKLMKPELIAWFKGSAVFVHSLRANLNTRKKPKE